GELDAVFHGLAVADLADQDHVGRLAQRILERRVPRIRIDTDLAVRDHAALVLVHVFDRILDRDDVTARLVVAIADHRGERSRLARPGTPDHDDQAALGEHYFLEHRRQFELLERRYLGVDQAD